MERVGAGEHAYGTSIDLDESEWRLGAHNYKPLDVVLNRGGASGSGTSTAAATSTACRPIPRVNQGHCHPKILAAMVEQAGKLAP